MESQTRPTRLIVNADDFGLSESVNRGIIEGVEAGVIKSASLLACGKGFDHAVELAREHPDLDLGVHLCLDEETPLLPGDEIPSIVGSDGHFLERMTLLKRLLITGDIDLSHVRAELRAQIRRCADAGVHLTHFDGHGHVHVYPRIVDIVIDLADEFGVRSCRLPAEPMRFLGKDFRLQAYLNKTIVAAFSRLARPRLRAAGIVMPDLFYGMVYGGRLTPALMRHLLEELPQGKVVEIMSHPGKYSPDELSPYLYWNYDWESELATLMTLADRFQERGGIENISFKELIEMSKHADDMGAYWDQAVLEWEKTSYEDSPAGATVAGEPVSLVERAAGLLRGHIKARQDSCLKNLSGLVADQVCVEIGCATGSTCFALLEMGAKKVIGLDISQRAIDSARGAAEHRGLEPSRIEFHRFAAGDDLPFDDIDIDIAVGLGICEYIEPSVLRDFVKQVGAESIFFSFDEKRLNLQKALHFFYRNFKGIPYYKLYSQAEIKRLLGDVTNGELTTFREGQNAFVTNLDR